MPDTPASTSFLTQDVARSKSRVGTLSTQPAFRRLTSVSIVIPCYNEEAGLTSLKASLAPLVENLRRDAYTIELVLVDDGSCDTTYTMLADLFPASSDMPVKLIKHERNQGLSSALRSAARAASGDVVCTLDADCTYPPSEVFALIETMVRTGADVVTGSPYHPQGGVENVQGWRLALSRGASWMYGAIVREKLYCYTSMFRVYRREWFRADFITSDHFVGVTEILVRAIRSGARVVEHPVVLRRRVYGVSKLRVGKATWEHLKFMGRIVASHSGLTRSL
jgi:dolichol-phosphate mannosyltransferase